VSVILRGSAGFAVDGAVDPRNCAFFRVPYFLCKIFHMFVRARLCVRLSPAL